MSVPCPHRWSLQRQAGLLELWWVYRLSLEVINYSESCSRHCTLAWVTHTQRERERESERDTERQTHRKRHTKRHTKRTRETE